MLSSLLEGGVMFAPKLEFSFSSVLYLELFKNTSLFARSWRQMLSLRFSHRCQHHPVPALCGSTHS